MLPRLMCTALALTLLHAPARAENNHDRDETKQPELHISLVIAPAVVAPHQTDRAHDGDDAVTYKLAPTAEEFSVNKEQRLMLVDGIRQEQVQVTTVVLK